jgi:hypothetical protein
MTAHRSELHLADADIAAARQRLNARDADDTNCVQEYVPWPVQVMLALGRPVVWAWMWCVLIPAGLAFSAWQALQAADAMTEFLEWTVAFVMSMGAILLGMTAGFLAAAPLIRRGYRLVGVLVLMALISCAVFLPRTLGSKLPMQSPGIAAKERTILTAIVSLNLRQRLSDLWRGE